MILKNQWVTKETEEKLKTTLMQKNGKTTYRNPRDASKTVLGGEYMVIQADFKKQESLK